MKNCEFFDNEIRRLKQSDDEPFNLFCREEKKKLLKAKDTYGQIYNRVKSQRKDPHYHKQTKEANGPSDDNVPSITTEEVSSSALVPVPSQSTKPVGTEQYISGGNQQVATINQTQLQPKKAPTIPKPKWHAPWKLYRVISGHLGWVRCVAVEPGNEWFATGAGDRVIKIWDLASGKLKLSLTGKHFIIDDLGFIYLLCCVFVKVMLAQYEVLWSVQSIHIYSVVAKIDR